MTALKISITGEPPTSAEIKAHRRNVRRDPGWAEQALFYTPVPGIDLLAGIAAGLAEYAIKGEDPDPFDDARGGLQEDWSTSGTSQAYVEKVRSQGRELIYAEYTALKSHDRIVRATKAGVKRAGVIAGDVAASFAKDVAAEAADTFRSFFKGSSK